MGSLLPVGDTGHLQSLCGRLDGAYREQNALAKRLIDEICAKIKIQPEQLTAHAEREASMKSKVVAHLLVDLE